MLNFSVIRWHVVQWLKQLSLPLVVALLLILACLFAYLVHIMPMLDQIVQNQHETQAQIDLQSRSNKQLKPVSDTQTSQNASEKVKQFYSRFPVADQLPDMLEKINLEAESHQLTLDKGDYKLKLLRSSKKNKLETTLVPYEITLPIEGDYRHIRAFINTVLSNMPMLAITDVQMQRDRIESKTIEARLRLVLYFSNQAEEGR